MNRLQFLKKLAGLCIAVPLAKWFGNKPRPLGFKTTIMDLIRENEILYGDARPRQGEPLNEFRRSLKQLRAEHRAALVKFNPHIAKYFQELDANIGKLRLKA